MLIDIIDFDIIDQLIDIISIQFFPLLFLVLKYLISFILLSIGFLYLLSLKGIFLKKKLYNKYKDNDFDNLRIIIGVTFIILAFGILFNYLIYFFIWLFQYFDGFLFVIINFFLGSYLENHIKLNNLISQGIALGSFVAILQFILAIFYFLNDRIVLMSSKNASSLFISSVISILLFGFECLPYLL